MENPHLIGGLIELIARYMLLLFHRFFYSIALILYFFPNSVSVIIDWITIPNTCRSFFLCLPKVFYNLTAYFFRLGKQASSLCYK